MIRQLLHWTALIGTAYLLLLALLWLLQGRLIHLPSAELIATPSDIGLDYEDLRLTTDDGKQLHGWYLPAPNAHATLLFLHGNAGNISHRLASLALFHDLGLNVLIIDYRGYGRSSGSPSETGLYRDGKAALDYLTGEREVPETGIIIFGRSLGGAVATHLAADRRIAGLILESSFSSAADLAGELYPWLPARWLIRYRYDTASKLAQVAAPVLIIHSRDDEIVPFHHALRLQRAAPATSRLLEIRGDHNGGFLLSRETYIDGLDAFIGRVAAASDIDAPAPGPG